MSKTYTGKDVAAVLTEARERMNQRGKHWIRGELRRKLPNGEVGYCSVGAIYAATRSPILRRRAVAVLETVLGGESVTWWNDKRAEGWSEVSKTFRKAAKLAAKS